MRIAIFTFIFVLVIALPFVFRKSPETKMPQTGADTLVIVTAHNESIKQEFDGAFRQWYRARHGKDIEIDWRSLGGTSEIIRFIDSTFSANFRYHWENELGQTWSEKIAAKFLNPKITEDDEAWEARQAFLSSDIGVGIDIFFGGGQYEFANLSRRGEIVPCGLKQRHPELFQGDFPILMPGTGAEIWYDKNDTYYGVCFSTFGICYNVDRLKSAGFSDEEILDFGNRWSDLADPRLFGAVGLADPSKSGSMNKCFEMLIQKEMQDRVAENGNDLDEAWLSAMTLLKNIGGNAAYLTFSASKVPMDTASGQIAVGMCIDYYGNSQAEWQNSHAGREIMRFRTPAGASSVTTDPVGIFRGAPNRQAAEEFVDFLFTAEGQRLWNNRPGTPGGPRKYCLHRLPVRRDMYEPEERKNMANQEADPFRLAQEFVYHPEWTGPIFRLMQQFLRVMLIDCNPELTAARRNIIGGEASDAQKAAFAALPFNYGQIGEVNKRMATPKGVAEACREWLDFFMTNYKFAYQK